MTEKSNTKDMTTRQIVIAFGLLFLSLGVMLYAKTFLGYLVSLVIFLIDAAWIASGSKKGG